MHSFHGSLQQVDQIQPEELSGNRHRLPHPNCIGRDQPTATELAGLSFSVYVVHTQPKPPDPGRKQGIGIFRIFYSGAEKSWSQTKTYLPWFGRSCDEQELIVAKIKNGWLDESQFKGLYTHHVACQVVTPVHFQLHTSLTSPIQATLIFRHTYSIACWATPEIVHRDLSPFQGSI